MIYPWLQSAWQKVSEGVNRLHHGLLIVGSQGIGKREFALQLAKYILCENKQQQSQPCDQCRNCHFFDSGTHADFHLIASEHELAHAPELLTQYADKYQNSKQREKTTKPSQIIAVDQIRALINQVATHAHLSTHKVVLIAAAERMNVNAANALLKLLEEPPSNTVLILLTADPGRLLPTISSRCSRIKLPDPDQEIARNWLVENAQIAESEVTDNLLSLGPIEACRQWQDGSYQQQQQCVQGLLQVLQKKTDPIVFAEKINKQELEVTLKYFQHLILSMIKQDFTNHRSVATTSSGDASYRALKRLFVLYDRISGYRKLSRDSINAQLAIEDITILASRVL